MAYPGNPSIAAETQKRILTTFSQTLDLARQGRIQEAALGCDFVLKMDPLFEPAGELQLRLTGASGPVEVQDLTEQLDRATTPKAPPQKEAGGGEGGGPSVAAASAASTVVISADDPMMKELRGGGEAAPPDVYELDLDASDDEPQSAPASLSAEPLPAGAAGDAQPASEMLTGNPSLEAAPPLESPAPSLGNSLGQAYSPEAAGRIEELLNEGHRQLEAGDHQAAIDAWSRIFLIDIDHDQANELIEKARQLKAEQERAVEEQYHEGLDALERGDLGAARTQLEAVRALHPSHVGVNEHLEQLERLERGEEQPAAAVSAPPPEAVPEEPALADLDDMFPEEGVSEAAAAAPLSGSASSKRGSGGFELSRPFALIAAGVLGLVLIGSWLLWSNWSTFFPNADETAVAPKRPRVDRLQEANRLYLAGDIEGAIAAAGKIPAISDDHQEAQQLIARWNKEIAELPPQAPEVEVTEEDVEAQKIALLEVARRAYGNREFYRAARNFQAAARLGELDASAQDLFDDARAQLRPIEQQLRLFRDGDYERILAPLWRVRVDEPENVDVRNLLADSYFNLAIRALRSGDPGTAAEHLGEATELDSSDLVAQRVERFASAYAAGTPRDLLYDIFVRGIELRTLADRG